MDVCVRLCEAQIVCRLERERAKREFRLERKVKLHSKEAAVFCDFVHATEKNTNF